MSSSFTLEAELRSDMGKGASRRLRHQGKVPAIMYGGSQEPTMLTLVHDDLYHSTEDEAFFAHILNVNYDGKSEKAIVKDLQRHPAKNQIMHLDLQRIDENKAIHVNVPLHFINEAKSIGVKKGGIVSHLMTEVEISCLPKDLPEYLELDLGEVDVGESLHLSDIQLPEEVSIIELTHGADHDLPIASIVMPRGEKEQEGEGGEEESSEE